MKEYERMAEEMTATIEGLKDQIKAHMGEQEEIIAGQYKVGSRLFPSVWTLRHWAQSCQTLPPATPKDHRPQIHRCVKEKDYALSTNLSTPNQSFFYDKDGNDLDFCRQQVKMSIEYDVLVRQYDPARLNELVELLVEMLCS